MRSFVVAADLDRVPWELMWPVDSGRTAGTFLAGMVPVTRRIGRRVGARTLTLAERVFVASPEADPAMLDEIATVRDCLGSEGRSVTDLHAVQRLLNSGGFGLMHLACRNEPAPVSSAVPMAGGPLMPLHLSYAANTDALTERAPLVFLNARGSAPTGFEDTTLSSWAASFLAAGAGAFIGSMWSVRSDTARDFASAFYQAFAGSRLPLAQAVHRARASIQGNGTDPTWLAYAVYGDPDSLYRPLEDAP
jgi:hypothetical protein